MHVIYDVSHNIAKVEEHIVDGKQKTLLVHRKVSLKFDCIIDYDDDVFLQSSSAHFGNPIGGRSSDFILHFVINTSNLRKSSPLC